MTAQLRHTPDELARHGFLLKRYAAKERPGAPTGFSGTGWELTRNGELVERRAFRYELLELAKTIRTRERAYDQIGGGNPHTLGTPQR